MFNVFHKEHVHKSNKLLYNVHCFFQVCTAIFVVNLKICVTTLNKYKVWNNHRFKHGIFGFIIYEPIHFSVSTILAHLLRWHCQTEVSWNWLPPCHFSKLLRKYLFVHTNYIDQVTKRFFKYIFLPFFPGFFFLSYW